MRVRGKKAGFSDDRITEVPWQHHTVSISQRRLPWPCYRRGLSRASTTIHSQKHVQGCGGKWWKNFHDGLRMELVSICYAIFIFAVESGFYFEWKGNTLAKIHCEGKTTQTSMKHSCAAAFCINSCLRLRVMCKEQGPHRGDPSSQRDSGALGFWLSRTKRLYNLMVSLRQKLAALDRKYGSYL